MRFLLSLFFSAVIALAFTTGFPVDALAQTPPPGYNSPWRNADGSEKLAIAFSGGWAPSVSSSRATQTRGWDYTMAAGRNFSRHYALLGEYSFYHFSLPPIPVATPLTPSLPSSGGHYIGNTHIWSLTAEGKYQYAATETVGAYMLAGGGAYRRNFDCGESACGNGFYGGGNVGTGLALKVSENANVKAFFELRYVWVATSSQVLATTATAGTKTSFVPVTAGFRW